MKKVAGHFSELKMCKSEKHLLLDGQRAVKRAAHAYNRAVRRASKNLCRESLKEQD
jgi:hypothetical protein